MKCRLAVQALPVLLMILSGPAWTGVFWTERACASDLPLRVPLDWQHGDLVVRFQDEGEPAPVAPEPGQAPALTEPEEPSPPTGAPPPTRAPSRNGAGLFDVPLEDLFGISIESPGTLTRTEPSPPTAAAAGTAPAPAGGAEVERAVPAVPRSTPAAVTRIDADTIWNTGARSLNELFDIYVPNVQVIRHHAAPPHLGIRGIISDKDDKYLLRVNSRLMNNRTQVGAFSEHYLPMLGDIHHIDFIRGPGSTTYGPGAISGVVNIVTHNYQTFEGTDVTVKGGLLEYFTTVEVRHGYEIDEDSGMFVYYGYGDYPGAPPEISPYVFGKSFIARDNIPVTAGDRVLFDIPNDHRTYRAYGRHKMHVQYNKGDLEFWCRYTRSGEQNVPRRDFIDLSEAKVPDDASFADLPTDEAGYQQYTAFLGYKIAITEKMGLDFAFSYDTFDFERLTVEVPSGYIAHAEDEYFSRLLWRWSPVKMHSFAVGYEFSHEDFGLASPGFPDLPAYTPRQKTDTRPWSTNSHSILGEYQLRLGDKWAGFLSGRADKHTYTEWLFSPRAAVAWMPDEKNTLKFIATESVRRIEDDVLRFQFLDKGTFSDVEKIQSLEFRAERQHCEHLWLATSVFYEDTGAVTFARLGDDPTGRSQLVGEFQIWGIEGELSYRTDNYCVQASHSYTDLVDGHLVDLNLNQGVSAFPYNDLFPDDDPFGPHLGNWSPHLTKVYIARQWSPDWSGTFSYRIYWGFPGGKDLTEYNNFLLATTGTPTTSLGLSDEGYHKAFQGNFYMDFGIQRKIRDCGVIRVDFYNVLGWLEIDWNKRNYLNRLSEYRAEAAAVALSGRFRF
jgi:iron complex outermembrane receptor protein